MILLIALVAVIAGVAVWAGAPWPLAIVAGLALPLVGSTLYLRVTRQDAPTGKLSPNDPRTRRFLAMLIERYRAQDYEHGAAALEEVLRHYDRGHVERASERFAGLSSTVAHSPYATMLISIWQGTWRDAGTPTSVDGREQRARLQQRASDPSPVTNAGSQSDIPQEGSAQGPWAVENAERDAGLFLRAVLYAVLSPDASSSAKAYATMIGRSVTEGNEKSLLVLLSGLTYFVGKVHFLRDDPMDDPNYLPYSRLLTAHFMNAATQCLPGPTAPREEVRLANAGRLAADVSQASMAMVEALGVVGSSAMESVS